MQIYSEASKSFIERLTQLFKDIANNEMNLKVRRSRFEYQSYTFPINIVVFEHPTRLGYFDSHGFQIGISKRLMYEAKNETLKNILRHEMAHLFTYLTFKDENLDIKHHGKEYHDVCRDFNWGKEVYSAKVDIEIENDSIEGDLQSERIISKVKKLLNLASSSNQNEAQLATIKANELLIRHNLTFIDSKESNESAYLVKVLHGKRVSAKHKAIYEILKTFLVKPIFNYSKNSFYLEVIGKKVNVQLAEYIAHFLDSRLEQIWKKTQEQNSELKGIRAKNSFMKGLAQGYVKKQKASTSDSLKSNSKDLVKLSNELNSLFEKVYPRTRSSTKKQAPENSLAKKFGQVAGSLLSINPALSGKEKVQKYLKK